MSSIPLASETPSTSPPALKTRSPCLRS